MRSLSAAALVVSVLSFASPVFAATYDIDPSHSSADFSIKHLMISNVRGTFSKVTGTVELDEKDISKSVIDATIDASTINTREDKRDGHLKSPDFFDVAKFPTITFKSTKLTKAGAHKLKALGDLTMHGVTKPVTLDVEYGDKDVKGMMGETRRAASASTKLNREDFGLTWNKALEAGGVAVGKEVAITIDIEMIKKGAEAPKAVTGQK